ncbi:MAG TPA: Hsp20/alpha crystallin family protein, partial [Rhodothermales bacterium]|nr:Hsp20/alpha crystallin family protein [Rhodothermales bacterium]
MAYPGRYLGRDFDRLRREMDRLFSDYQPARAAQPEQDDEQQAVWAPRADLAETEHHFVIALDVPGVSEDDLRLTLEEDTLKVSGERRFNREGREGQFHRIERSYGRFFRAFRFGSPIDAQGVEASFDDGVLTVTVPKAEVSKPRRIEVRRSSSIGGASVGSEGSGA